MSDKSRVLVVEDEEAILLGLAENLSYAGHDVLKACDGPSALEVALRERPDLILLDIMLPGLTGFEVCRQLRDKGLQTPVIMLTARGDEFDKLHGFEMGADDYVTKPFSVDELLARVKAVLARGKARSTGPRTYTFDDVVLDLDSRTLTQAGNDVTVTRTEFDLLAYFLENEGKALSRDQVMNDVWGTEYYGTQRSLDSFVANLRRKIEKDTHNPVHILTVHGVGYKFVK
ncbi:MAG: response regulator transcription factor [Verrucomicrobia bacterium]|jgi:two-component system, OmpR family, alkaline phosphatase synthesis response regulator PhoP|nr:response regulator transcription factor [Verrucomicrobiota bacterium]